MRPIRTVLSLTGAALLTAGLAAGTVTAQPAPTADTVRTAQARAAGLSEGQAAQLQDRIDAHRAGMKVPAQQVSFDEIRANDGTTITFTAPGSALGSGCSSGRLCLWAGDKYDHKKLTFYRCAFRDLSDYGFNDRLTSLKNRQSSGTRAKFYNWEGHWSLKFGSTAPHNIPDLQGTPYNNMIDGVRVC
ncbi:hypothetical protein [Streptomyces sp. NPDC002790]|uniref:peptidase inhibitor family I36 protein n=1 Tax=Streptomyces sp. NPDC002790 TaxID=3154431 RepID=UPI003328CFB8